MNQHVGNFPGVTVDITLGEVPNISNCQIVDLPGLYSLETYSEDENVTKNFLYTNKPEAIINVVDSMNLQRALYLSLQLKEIGIPMVIALNMLDEVKKNNGRINIEKLEKMIEVPIVPITSITEKELEKLLTVTRKIAKKSNKLNEIKKENVEMKYNKIDNIYKEVIFLPQNKREKKSYKIDTILTNKILGIPIFIGIMYIIFTLTSKTKCTPFTIFI